MITIRLANNLPRPPSLSRILNIPGNYRVGSDSYTNSDQSERSHSESIIRGFEEIANDLRGLQRFNRKVNRTLISAKISAISGLGIGGVFGASLFFDWAKDLALNIKIPFLQEYSFGTISALMGLSFTIGYILAKHQYQKSTELRTMYQTEKRIRLYRAFAEFCRIQEDLTNASKIPTFNIKQEKRLYKSLLQIFNGALTIDVSTKRKEWQMRNYPEKEAEHQGILEKAEDKLNKRGYGKLTVFFDSPYDSPEKEEEIQKPISYLQQWYYRFSSNRKIANSLASEFAKIGEGDYLVRKETNVSQSIKSMIIHKVTKLSNKRQENSHQKVNPAIYKNMLNAFERDGKYIARGGVIAREVIRLLEAVIKEHSSAPTLSR